MFIDCRLTFRLLFSTTLLVSSMCNLLVFSGSVLGSICMAVWVQLYFSTTFIIAAQCRG